MSEKIDLLIITNNTGFNKKCSDFIELLMSRDYSFDILNPAVGTVKAYKRENFYSYKVILLHRLITDDKGFYLKLIDFLKSGGGVFITYTSLGLFGELDTVFREFCETFFSSRYQKDLLFDTRDFLERIETIVVKKENIKNINESELLQKLYQQVSKIVLGRPIRIYPKHNPPKAYPIINTNPSTQLENKTVQFDVERVGTNAICGFMDFSTNGKLCVISGFGLWNDLFNLLDNRIFISNILSFLIK